MASDENWQRSLRDRPVTTLLMSLICIPMMSVVYIAVFIDDAELRILAWIIWSVATIYLIWLLFSFWRLEERGLLSDQAKLRARRCMWWAGWVLFAGAWLAILWPAAPLRLRIQGAAVLCGLLVGARHLKPLLKQK